MLPSWGAQALSSGNEKSIGKQCVAVLLNLPFPSWVASNTKLVKINSPRQYFTLGSLKQAICGISSEIDSVSHIKTKVSRSVIKSINPKFMANCNDNAMNKKESPSWLRIAVCFLYAESQITKGIKKIQPLKEKR